MKNDDGLTRKGPVSEDETPSVGTHTMFQVPPVTHWVDCLILAHLYGPVLYKLTLYSSDSYSCIHVGVYANQ